MFIASDIRTVTRVAVCVHAKVIMQFAKKEVKEIHVQISR